MGLESGAADRYGLAKVQRERRWTAITDAFLALSVLGCLTGFVTPSAFPAWWTPVLAVLAAAMIVHRVLVTLEARRRMAAAVRRTASAPAGGHQRRAA